MSDMQPNPYESPRDVPGGPDQKAIVPPPSLAEGFKDRSTGLMLFGGLEILLGAMIALMIPLTALSSSLQPPGAPATNPRVMIPALVMYAVMAVVLVWLGIGSILARRWARALTLVLSWLWLIAGVLGMAWFVVAMSSVWSQMQQQGRTSPGVMAVGLIVGGVCVGCLYVLLPGAFVLFYRSEHVKATCEARDPQIRWTDKCPLPVLALVVMQAWGAFVMLGSPLHSGTVPMFGVLLRGLPGAVVALAVAVLLSWLAWGAYRLKMSAWWGSVVLFVLGGLSAIVTFSRVSMMEFYRGMDMTEQQLEAVRPMVGMMDRFMPWVMAVSLLVWLGYLVYVREYFVAPSIQNSESSSNRAV